MKNKTTSRQRFDEAVKAMNPNAYIDNFIQTGDFKGLFSFNIKFREADTQNDTQLVLRGDFLKADWFRLVSVTVDIKYKKIGIAAEIA